MNVKLLETLALFGKRLTIVRTMTEGIINDADGTNSLKGQKIARDIAKIKQKIHKIELETKSIIRYANTPDLLM